MKIVGERMKKTTIFVSAMLIVTSCLFMFNIDVTAQDGLIAEYHFDENAGNTLSDSSGNGNHGTIHGAIWTNGISGSALSFDGTDDYVECGATLTNTVLSEITIEVLTMPLAFQTPSDYVFYDGSDGEFTIVVGEEGSCSISIKAVDGNAYWTSYFGIQVDNWYHIVGQYTGSSLRLFVNGILRNETNLPVVGLFNPGGNYYPTIGAYSDAGNGHRRYYNGVINKLNVYNRVLSAEEILEHYQATNGNGGETPNQGDIIAEYHFDENSGMMVGDSSGNNNNGTIYGATWTTGISGSALSFDGVDDHVEISNLEGSDSNDKLTVSVWVKSGKVWNPDDFLYNNIISKGSIWDSGYGLLVYERIYDHKTKVQFWIMDSSGREVVTTDVNNTWAVDDWVLVTGVYNNSSLKLYIDGILQSQLTTTISPDLTPDILNIAGPASLEHDGDLYFNGKIDELKIYNRALTAEEIYSHYELDYAPQPLIAKLNLEEQFLNLGETTIFDGSESTGPELSEYFFDFGDEQNSGWTQSHSLSHSYNAPGIFEATLTVRNSTGNMSENSIKKVYVGTMSNFTENKSFLTPLWEVKASQSHPDDECVVYDVAVSNNGTYSAYCVVCGYVDATDYRGVRCYNKDGTLAWDVSRNSGTPYEIAMSDDGTISVVRWSDGDIEAYSDNGEILWNHNVPDASAISMCPDGKKVVVGSFIEGTNSELILYESGTLKWAAWTYGGIEDVKISMDGNKIYAGTAERTFYPLEEDNKLYCFSNEGINLWSKQFTTAVISLDTTADGATLLLLTDDGNTTVLDDSGDQLWAVDVGWFDPTISADGEIITIDTLSKLLVFNQSGYLIWKNDSFDSSFIGTSYAMVSRCGEAVVHPYGLNTGEYGIIVRDKAGNCVYHYTNDSRDSGFRVAVSPDGKYIAAGSGNDLLLLSLNPTNLEGDASEIPGFEIWAILSATVFALVMTTIIRRKRQ